MRKNFVLLLLFCSVLAAGFSQERAHIGFHANFNSVWILNQNNYGTLDGFNNQFARASELDYKLKFGYTAGFNLGYDFNRRHGVQFALQFSSMGQNYEDDIKSEVTTTQGVTLLPINVKRNVTLNYFEIPLLYKFTSRSKVQKGVPKRVHYYLMVGPQIGLVVSEKEDITIEDPAILYNVTGINASLKFQNFDLGMIVHNGIEVKLSKQWFLTAGLELYFGLIDINGKTIKDLEWFSKNDVSYKPSHNFRGGLQVGVHYVIGNNRFY